MREVGREPAPHVNVDRIDVKPVRQAGVARFVREA